MFKKRGFDSKRYIDAQSTEILKRVNKFDRLYLEFGGHLCYDGHASRVLPGYKPSLKIDLLKSLGDIEIIYCVNSKDIAGSKRLGDFNLDYKNQVLKDISDIEKRGLKVNHIVFTRYDGEVGVKEFLKKIKSRGHKTYLTKEVKDYIIPKNAIKSYKENSYVKVKSNVIIVTGAAGGSGKMAICMSQVYHDLKNKKNAGYAKFETFPVWNLSLNHPINLAYEAATADLGDINMIDPYHLKAYKKRAVNYNRDIENFEILKSTVKEMTKKRNPFGYKSPTDMGVSKVKDGIINELVCQNAAIKEIKRRMKVYKKEVEAGRLNEIVNLRMKKIVGKLN